MRAKQIIVNFGIILAVALAIVMVVRINLGESSNSIRFFIYTNSGYSKIINRVFRILPPRYYIDIDENNVDETREYKFTCYTDIGASYPIYYKFITDKISNKNFYLAFDNKFNLEQNSLHIFNSFISSKDSAEMLTKQSVIKLFCLIFANACDTTDSTYIIIDNSGTLKQFLLNSPINNRPIDRSDFVDASLLDFNLIKTDLLVSTYVWYNTKGIYKFNFTFDESNRITNCKIDRLGFIGNEIQKL